MPKIVINRQYGGFCVSHAALMRMRELGSKQALEETAVGETWPDSDKVRDAFLSSYHLEDRSDPILVQVVEELGALANGDHATLEIVNVPDDVSWHIADYDGYEHVAENHRTW